MNLTFGIAMLSFISLGMVSVIGLFWSYYKKKQKRPWLIFFMINVLLLGGSLALYNHLLTPEERITINERREQLKKEHGSRQKSENPIINRQNSKEPSEVNPPEATITSHIQTNKYSSNISHHASASLPAAAVLRTIASKSLGKYFINIEINDFIDDNRTKIVLVHYNGAAGWDNEKTRKAMLIQTADLFKNVFASGIAIQEITAFIYTDTTKPNSDSQKNLAMKCQLKGSTAANIKWNDINAAQFNQYIDSTWTAPFLRK